MTDFQPLLQKPEAPSDARAEFERGLEELMSGHLDDCMSFASCSSSRNPDDEDDEADQLVRRRRRSDIEGDDLAESSATRRRQSRILSRWAARQAQEMITTTERRNREEIRHPEINNSSNGTFSSTGDWLFIHEPSYYFIFVILFITINKLTTQMTTTNINLFRPRIISSWAWSYFTVEKRKKASISKFNSNVARFFLAVKQSGLHIVSMLDSSFLRGSESPTSRGQGGNVDRPSTQASAILQMWRELEDEHLLNRARKRVRERLRQQRNADDNRTMSSMTLNESRESENHRSVGDVTESENEYGTWPNDQGSSLLILVKLRGRGAGNRRAEWLGETERERVRIVREWVQMSSQQRGVHWGHREDQAVISGAQVDRVPDGSVNEQDEGQPEHIQRDLLRLRGRQAVINLLVRTERERQRELQGLLEHRAVSDFAHRNRIQSLLRGRFLHERPVEEERPPSVAVSELNQLRQWHTVSGLRNTVSNMLAVESISWQENATQGGNWREPTTNSERESWQQSRYAQFNEWREGNAEEMDTNWQESSDSDYRQDIPGNVNGEESGSQEAQRFWHEDGSREAVENWSEGPSDPPRAGRATPVGRFSRFHSPEDDNVYSMELRELLSRRSFSNLLRSGFRESLDQLKQSYVERQGRSPIDWDLHRNLPTPASPECYQEQQRDETNDNQNDASSRPSLVLPSPPVPPPQPLKFEHACAAHMPLLYTHTSEWEMINDLRADMVRLQQGMNHMQRMLEACMDMQLELQRSVRQEVSAALNHSASEKGDFSCFCRIPGSSAEASNDGSNWGHVRKGTTCVCCDSHTDSLLYRCGHMCTCLKCANELVRGGGKCSLCRAPIVEVIRAYSIL
ncbi:hypothetical protein ES332_A05G322000v1 [Gossypium tomentosum]|uniref:RING-type domain-containing protein n=1 Tax=Gossypium tomentosum TaxID=34277 RepID=A0A5D2QN32_GOSTO|nr:hypothetical protein ES332_A05G322000v1 [Gossypium tomentosum]